MWYYGLQNLISYNSELNLVQETSLVGHHLQTDFLTREISGLPKGPPVVDKETIRARP